MINIKIKKYIYNIMYKKTVESYGIDFTQIHADTKDEYVIGKFQCMITEIPTDKIAEAEEQAVAVEEPVANAETPATEDIAEDVPATVEDVPVTTAKTTSRKKSKK